MCVGLHATDNLNLQNEMQTYDEDMDGILEYINKLHQFINTPTLILEYCILHGINTLSSAIKDSPTATYETQIQAITKIWDICTGWSGIDTPRKSQVHELTIHRRRSPRVEKLQPTQKAQQPPRVPEHNNPPKPTTRVHIQNQVPASAPRVNPKKEPDQEPVGRLTHSQ